MKTFSKRLSAVFLSVYMVFGVVSTDYLTVQAFEWAVPSLTVGESLLWLMGLLGMTYSEGASAWRDVSPEYEQDFIDYANEHGMTYNQTSTWLNDVAAGKLNQLSQVWTSFKEWVKSLVPSSSDSDAQLGTSTMQELIPKIFDIYGVDFSYSNLDASQLSAVPKALLCFTDADKTFLSIIVFPISNDYYFDISGGQLRVFPSSTYYTYRFDSSGARYSASGGVYVAANNQLLYSYADISLTTTDLQGFALSLLDLSGSDVSDSDFKVYNPSLIPDINFADSNTEDASIPGVIDLPWGNLGDSEEERDKTYDDLVGGLDLGKEIGDLWQALQDLMGVLAVDDVGVLQPNSGGDNPPTLEDEAENNKVNGAFVLTGLQKVFPFCIPFDLYAFITLLEAPPVAPVIQYPIYNPVTKSNEIITIDFSTWESVVILFRYIFDFLFIIGLLLMARALIGGGDSA